MMHVGMNIEDKAQLFKEVYRVLRLGVTFGVYDIMRLSAEDLKYPVPWATVAATSNLASSDQYIKALEDAGFSIILESNRLEIALSFFKEAKEKSEEQPKTPPANDPPSSDVG